MLDGRPAERYKFVTLAHHFLISGLPLTAWYSKRALAAFVEGAAACRLWHADREAVLLQTLMVVEPYTGGTLPSLVERFLRDPRHSKLPLVVFNDILAALIRKRGIGDPVVERAIADLECRFSDSQWTEAAAATDLDITASQLSFRFKARTGVTWTSYRRDLRLSRAAELLQIGNRPTKEVWSAVGYNDGSNFAHEFKQKFGVSPRAFRNQQFNLPPEARPRILPEGHRQGGEVRSILLVDDDGGSRRTLARYLEEINCEVCTASTGTAALAALERDVFQAVLVDYHLPDMTGLQCLLQWRTASGSQIPAAILTADWEVEDEICAISNVGAMLASKLCSLEDLGRLVSSLFALHGHFTRHD